LINAIDYAKTKNDKIHIAYIDLAKAYDSVEYWGIVEVLENLGFNDKFVALIKAMCSNNKAQIITPFGLTEEINLGRGIPQRSPISPILFDLFLEPLLNWINNNALGFKLNTIDISVLAFADDMCLLSNTNSNLQINIDKTQEFCF